MSASRSLSVAHLSANMRRTLHDDIHKESFRTNLDRYLTMFSELVEEEWSTFKELQTFTTGFNLEIMFADRSADASAIQAADPESATQPYCKEKLSHLMSLARKLGYYAIPAKSQPDPGVTTYLCFQLLGFRPWARRYIQKLTQWAKDEWQGHLSCAVLGSFNVVKDWGEESQAQGAACALVGRDVQFTSRSCSIQPVALDEFFVGDHVDFLREFQGVFHKAEFDAPAILEMVDDDLDSDGADTISQSLARLVYKLK